MASDMGFDTYAGSGPREQLVHVVVRTRLLRGEWVGVVLTYSAGGTVITSPGPYGMNRSPPFASIKGWNCVGSP